MKPVAKAFFLFQIIAFTLFSESMILNTESSFPDKPVKIIVYTGPGGLIDVTARKFTDIASKYTNVTFVVENKPGAGGIVALKKVLQLPADGYTLYACTKSNISKFVSTGGSSYIESLDWLAMLMADPECIITTNTSRITSWQELVADAQQKGGEQIWVGPATGGLDHVTALKVWDKFGFKAKWIPFKSGGKARAALLGNQGAAYVGNPREVLGNPDLNIAVISAKQRLERFPEVPVFAEFDSEGNSDNINLDYEYMWRGFAIKKGVDPYILLWYKKLFQAVTNDPEWREFWERGGIDVVYYGPDKFIEIVREDRITFTHYLKKLNILKSPDLNFITKMLAGKGLVFLISFFILILAAIGFITAHSSKKYLLDRILIISGFILLSILFYLLSYLFPESGTVGPAVVPRLWIFILIPLNILLLINTLNDKSIVEVKAGNHKLVFSMIALLAMYLAGIYFLGYFLSSLIFISLSLHLLGYKKVINIMLISVGWVLFSWLVFYKLLYVPLPIGIILELF